VIGVAHENSNGSWIASKSKILRRWDTDLKPEELRGIIAAEKQIILAEQHAIPDDPYEQLRVASRLYTIRGWAGGRSIRAHQSHSRRPGTAVNVQAMVFGNMGKTAAPASPLPATLRPARRNSMASIC